jgi:colanic acid/amylovoran biosynthesis glycosyltransferase
MPRVALFTPRFVPASQTFIFEESTRYQRYEAEVFTRFRMNEAQFPFAPVHALAHEGGAAQSLESFLYQATTLSPTFFGTMRRRRFDIIHGLFGRSAVNALAYQARFDLPLVVTFRGADVAVLTSRRRALPVNVPYWLLSGRLFRKASRYVAVSQDLVERLLRAGADPAKLAVWHAGVAIPPAIERSASSPGPLRILIVGRFVEKKGIEFGLQAFAELARDRPNVRLRIVGDGPPRGRYEAIARATGVGDRIAFLGMQTHEELRSELAETDLLFAPSVTVEGDVEGVPTVMMEANARSIPVVAARTGGLPEIVEDGVTGLLTRERDVSGLAAALRALVDDGGRRVAMGVAARRKMEREHNIVDRMALIERMYDEAIDEHRARRGAVHRA